MPTLLDVQDVSLAFGGLQALSRVSLQVDEHAIVGLIGPNGAGKTTLFNVISGLQAADSGTIRFDGRDVTTMGANRRAALGVGRSFQNLGLVRNETVLTNLLAAQYLGARYRGWDTMVRPWRWRHDEHRLRRRAVEVATALGLESQLHRRVQDLPFAGARFTELACVLVEEPRLMLLDEPTTGLDPREVEQLLRVLRHVSARGTTILLVAHDVRFVMAVCDRIYVLAEGTVLVDGPPGVVQSHPQVIEAYLGRSA